MLATPGSRCNSSSQCANGCLSNYCCASNTTAHVVSCAAGSGLISSCEVGYITDHVLNQSCFLPACAADDECSSLLCLMHCCANNYAYCTACGTSGECTGCTSGYAVTAGLCLQIIPSQSASPSSQTWFASLEGQAVTSVGSILAAGLSAGFGFWVKQQCKRRSRGAGLAPLTNSNDAECTDSTAAIGVPGVSVEPEMVVENPMPRPRR